MREHRELGRAPVHLGRVLADHRDARPRLDERARDERVLAEHRRADDDEHDVVRRERLAQARPVGRQVAGEERVVLREPGARAERLLPDRAREPLGQSDERASRSRGRRRRLRRRASGLLRRRRRGSASCRDGVCGPPSGRARRVRGAARSSGSGASADQSSIGTITSAGPRAVTAS